MNAARIGELKPEFNEKVVFRIPSASYDQLNFPANTFKWLISAFEIPILKEAIFLSSPILFSQWVNLISFAEVVNKIELEKTFNSVFKYYLRMHTRCTPFGAFAGVGMGHWQVENKVSIASQSSYIRLDMKYLHEISQSIITSDAFKRNSKLFLNNTVRIAKEGYYFLEPISYSESASFRLSLLNRSDVISELCKLAEKGVTVSELTCFLSKYSSNKAEIETLVHDLMSSRFLINSVTTPFSFYNFCSEISEISKYEPASSPTFKLFAAFESIAFLFKDPSNQHNLNIKFYQEITKKLDSNFGTSKSEVKYHVDTFVECQKAFFNEAIKIKLLKTIQFLNRITKPNSSKNIKDFKERFKANFGEQEVSLLFALDSEAGIGYVKDDFQINQPLISELNFSNDVNEYSLKMSSVKESLMAKIIFSIKHKKDTILLSEADFVGVDYYSSNIPPVLSVVFKIIDSKSNKIQFLFANKGYSFLGRFSEGNPEISKLINELSSFEAAADYFSEIAEIVHIPDAKSANVISRSSSSKFEIPIITPSNKKEEHQLLLSDLFISVRNEKIILRSKKLNKRVVPRLSSAHNFSTNALPVYQFLCDLQFEDYDKSFFGLSTTDILRVFSYVPRIEFESVIISPATWYLKEIDIIEIRQFKGDSQLELFNNWKTKYNLPNEVFLTEADNDLYFDFNQAISVQLFIQFSKNRKSIQLTEVLLRSGVSPFEDKAGFKYANECIAFLQTSRKSVESILTNKIQATNKVRKYGIGSEWIYFKIYCGLKASDYLIANVLLPACTELKQKSILLQWFFVRYTDPDFHLRFRVKVGDYEQFSTVNSLLRAKIESVPEHFVKRVEIAEYERELERYGPDFIEFAEQIFDIDSNFISTFLATESFSEEDFRWQLAVKSIHDFLVAFNYDKKSRHGLTNSLAQHYFQENGSAKQLKLQLDSKYRIYSSTISQILKNDIFFNQNFNELQGIMVRRKIELVNIYRVIKVQRRSSPTSNLDYFVSSIIHMFCNRVFQDKQRTNEMVLYHFLSKYYKTDLILEAKSTL